MSIMKKFCLSVVFVFVCHDVSYAGESKLKKLLSTHDVGTWFMPADNTFVI